MTLSLYQASVPVCIRALNNLAAILKKAEVHAAEKKIDPGVFITARLAPTMYPLSRQIQIATDIAKGGAARLAGVENPSYADTETTFDELQARLAKTIAFLQTIKAEQVDGNEDKDIKLKVGGRELEFKGQAYLLTFVLPNVFFHVTTAYAILRHNGVELSKADYLGA